MKIKIKKERKSQRKAARKTEKILKGTDEEETETAFQALKEWHKVNKEITRILEGNKSEFRIRLPNRLPPKRKFNHGTETLEGVRILYQQLYQPSAAKLAAAKQNIQENWI